MMATHINVSGSKKVSVQDATYLELDWAISRYEGSANKLTAFTEWLSLHDCGHFTYTKSWSFAGPIISREFIRWNREPNGNYYAWMGGDQHYDPLFIPLMNGSEGIKYPDAFEWGATIIEACMRCFVSYKAGATIDVPFTVKTMQLADFNEPVLKS